MKHKRQASLSKNGDEKSSKASSCNNDEDSLDLDLSAEGKTTTTNTTAGTAASCSDSDRAFNPMSDGNTRLSHNESDTDTQTMTQHRQTTPRTVGGGRKRKTKENKQLLQQHESPLVSLPMTPPKSNAANAALELSKLYPSTGSSTPSMTGTAYGCVMTSSASSSPTNVHQSQLGGKLINSPKEEEHEDISNAKTAGLLVTSKCSTNMYYGRRGYLENGKYSQVSPTTAGACQLNNIGKQHGPYNVGPPTSPTMFGNYGRSIRDKTDVFSRNMLMGVTGNCYGPGHSLSTRSGGNNGQYGGYNSYNPMSGAAEMGKYNNINNYDAYAYNNLVDYDNCDDYAGNNKTLASSSSTSTVSSIGGTNMYDNNGTQYSASFDHLVAGENNTSAGSDLQHYTSGASDHGGTSPSYASSYANECKYYGQNGTFVSGQGNNVDGSRFLSYDLNDYKSYEFTSSGAAVTKTSPLPSTPCFENTAQHSTGANYTYPSPMNNGHHLIGPDINYGHAGGSHHQYAPVTYPTNESNTKYLTSYY